MRRVLSLLGVVVSIPVLLAVPVISRPAVAPAPVQPHLLSLAVDPLPTVHGVVADTGPHATKHFTLVGATWRSGTLPRSESVQIRTHDAGHWSAWSSLSLPDEAPDDGSADARAAAAAHLTATDPLWVGSADGVQARVVAAGTSSATAPAGLHVVMVDGGSSHADARPGAPRALGGSVADAAESQPTIYTRAQWGADERLRTRHPGCATPSYGSQIKMGFIHHTDGVNGYSAGQVPSIIRSIYAYHVESNGWCDIGYNFLVDRFGRIWEGRYGGITKPVLGAHTGGFNTDSFGASLIGNFTSTAPSAAMLAAVEKLFAWKLGNAYANPLGKTQMHAGSFSGSRYRTGSTVTFNVVSGHRDADTTTCPGNAAYSQLPKVRAAIAKLMGAGFVTPSVSTPSIRMLSGQSLTVKAGVIGAQSWTATLSDATGTTIRTLTGTAGPSAPVAAVWDGNVLDGTPAPPGTYTVTLTGADGSGAADIPYRTTVSVTPPVTVTGPATAAYNTPVTLTGTAMPNAAVTVTLQPAAQGAAADVRTVTADGNGAWNATFTANDDYSWSAATQGWSTPTSATTIAPALTSPAPAAGGTAFVAQGRPLALSGTGKPGTTVTVVSTPAGGPSTSATPITVAADGTWTGGSVTPTAPTTVVLRRDATTASAPLTVYPVGAVSATVARTGYAQRTVAVTGNAGAAPLAVQLWTRAAGAASWSLVRTVTASPTGAFAAALALPPTTAPSALDWQVLAVGAGTTYGTVAGSVSVLPLFPPAAAAPATGLYRQTLAARGTAVPGDTVVLWTRPATGGSWARAAHTVAAPGSGAFALRLALLRDTYWRVTTPTGATPARTVYVRPTLRGVSRGTKNAMIRFSGTAIPGQRVGLYRRPAGTTKWHYVGAMTATSSGAWTGHFRLVYPMNVVARLHNQLSNVLTIRIS